MRTEIAQTRDAKLREMKRHNRAVEEVEQKKNESYLRSSSLQYKSKLLEEYSKTKDQFGHEQLAHIYPDMVQFFPDHERLLYEKEEEYDGEE